MNIVLQGVITIVLSIMVMMGANSLIDSIFRIRNAKIEEKELSKKTLVELKKAQEGLLSEVKDIKEILRVSRRWKK